MIKKGLLQVLEKHKEVLVDVKLECDSDFIDKQDIQEILKMLEGKSGNTVKTMQVIFEQLLQAQEEVIENEECYGNFNGSFTFLNSNNIISNIEKDFAMIIFVLKFLDGDINEFCNDNQIIKFKTVNHYGFTEEKFDDIVDMVNLNNYSFFKLRDKITNSAFTNSGFVCNEGKLSKLLKSEFEKYACILLELLNNLSIDSINSSDVYSEYNYDKTTKNLIISIKDVIVFTIDKNIETNDINICVLFKDSEMDIYPGVSLIIEGTVVER